MHGLSEDLRSEKLVKLGAWFAYFGLNCWLAGRSDASKRQECLKIFVENETDSAAMYEKMRMFVQLVRAP